MGNFTVEFYQTKDGSCPAEEFILQQNIKMQVKIFRLIKLLEMDGNALREPESKHLDDGIFELRAIQGSDITRMLYFFVVGRKIIITNGFVKKTDRTPVREIEKAKRYRAEYMAETGGTDGKKYQ